ncbi:glycoside hydrolase domain-containing protein [Kocuria massiliensis]|uniref:glycoside hydrolase domain-containing protein n=1 Tax=Kocuria massiliensis TaxID=1926282 RepID=UPI0022B9ADBA|nr:glycoside hydrolase domain-containing protein [Kocuria massiliensis]
MDQKVKEAQQWVNRTYGTVPGYQPCPEDGATGWATMYSLIMGLQHELGIRGLVANYGPGTTARVSALGPIGRGWSKNKNIVRILQHGLFCKGYWGAYRFGEFNVTTTAAVKQLQTNMGIPATGTVDAELFRCILNMDAYVVVAGGTENIRGIQQWLNGRYYGKPEFSIGPADGIYSRDVQKSLMIALQYELGIGEPNGNFGPATRSLLKQHELSVGSSGIFVELFSAVCVFNEPVPESGGVVRSNRREHFDPALAYFVGAFQKFSQLPVTGRADFATWAQLLVSMGDPDRPTAGCDTRFEITEARAEWLKSHGYEIVGRYLYNPAPGPGEEDLDKNIKPGELERIFRHGLRVFPIFQDNGRRREDFTYGIGFRHGLLAHSLTSGFGFNPGTVIYFAVDADFTQQDIDDAVVPYFHGVGAGLASKGKKYLHGVYGSRNVCTNVTEKTFARFSFVAGMSWGFSGNLGFSLPKNWSVNQIKEFRVYLGEETFDLDNDVWRLEGGDPGQTSIHAPFHGIDDFLESIETLYNLAEEYSLADPNVLVCNFYRQEKYDDPQWTFVIGKIDKEFVAFAQSQGAILVTDAVDAVTGYTLDTQHLMATLEGHLKHPHRYTARANIGDITGWAGDLLTWYKNWRTDEEDYSSGYEFCRKNFAIPGRATSFGYSDLLADADGFILANAIGSGVGLLDALRNLYRGGGSHRRIRDFFEIRFQDAVTVKKVAHDLLAGSVNPVIVGARLLLVWKALQPLLLPPRKLDEFEQGFSDVLLERLDG